MSPDRGVTSSLGSRGELAAWLHPKERSGLVAGLIRWAQLAQSSAQMSCDRFGRGRIQAASSSSSAGLTPLMLS